VNALCRLISHALSPRLQLQLAWAQLVVTLIGWPLSLVFVQEPPVILSLSWWAVLVTSMNYIASAQANEKVSKE
jgi:hypothetical protein